MANDDNIGTFLARAAEAGDKESEGTFTTAGKEVVQKIGRCLLGDDTRWVLLLVQAANLFGVADIRVSFSGGIRVEMSRVGDRRDWLDGFVQRLLSGDISLDPLESTLQKAVWSGLAQCRGKAVLAAAGGEGEEPRAVRLGLSETRWGQAALEPESFLLLIEPDNGEYLDKLRDKIVKELERYACSDKTRILCTREIKGFLPISPRLEGGSDHRERGLPVGLWAWAEKGEGIPLGESFTSVDSKGMERKELTFGTFRTCLVGKAPTARSVVAFTHHRSPVPSRAVWLWQGTEVAHHDLAWKPDTMAVTLYVEAPKDIGWDIGQREFRWEERMSETLDRASRDIKPSLEMLVKEYNQYSPKVEGATVGCWALLLTGCLALAGVAAPLIGGKLALALGGILGSVLIVSEFRFRHRERYSLGHALSRLATNLEELEDQRLWSEQPMHPGGGNFTASSP